MTDLAASGAQCLELPIPSILVRRDSRPYAPPVRVPELAPRAIAGIGCRCDVDFDERKPDGRPVGRELSDVSPGPDLDELRVEWMELESQLPGLRSERSAMRGKLAGLRREIRAAQMDRDELLALAAALRERVAELSSEQRERVQEELPALRREVHALRRRNSELEGLPAGFRIPTEILRIGFWIGRQRFDDS